MKTKLYFIVCLCLYLSIPTQAQDTYYYVRGEKISLVADSSQWLVNTQSSDMNIDMVVSGGDFIVDQEIPMGG